MMKKERLLVTGGAGFIGAHLVRWLLNLGHEVVILDDLSTGSEAALDPRAELVIGDITEDQICLKVTSECSRVFHLAAHRSVLRSVHSPFQTNHVNIQGTLNLLQAARDVGVERFVFASSSTVYGGAEVATNEEFPKTPQSPYAVSKLAGEHYVRVFSQLYKIPAVSLRFFNVYGPGQCVDGGYACAIPLFLTAISAKTSPVVFGDGHQRRDFTYIDDVIRGILAAGWSDPKIADGRAFNLGAGNTKSILTLLSHLQSLAGTQLSPQFESTRLGDARTTHADITAAARELNWQPSTSLEEGLRETYSWWNTFTHRDRTTSKAKL